MKANLSRRKLLWLTLPILLGCLLYLRSFSVDKITPNETRLPPPLAHADPAAPSAAAPIFPKQKPPAKQPALSPGAADRYPGATVLSQKETTAPDGRTTRVRLIKADFKYPLLRLEDTLDLPAAGGAKRVVKQRAMVADHVLVKARAGIATTDFEKMLARHGAKVRRRLPRTDLYLVQFPAPELDTVPNAVRALSAEPALIQYAEPDYLAYAEAIPNDARLAKQWSLRNTGERQGGQYFDYPGVPGADIAAAQAWDICTGSSSVVVGVIDTGVDYTHPDLVPNIWKNPAEIPGNGIDDDGNGYIDDTRGWDFYDDENDPMDENDHGTHCSGILGAAGNNGAGISGVCWRVSIVPIRFLGPYGDGTYSDAVAAIHYATELGVTLTSNSWAGYDYSEALKEAVDSAEAAGILVIAAAANAASNNDVVSYYPASLTNANVITVAATDHRDEMSYYSNYGASSVHLGAPGSWILSTVLGGTEELREGTSQAAPHVAGACALVKAYRPELTGSAIKRIVLSSVDQIPAMTGRVITGGRLNLHQALLTSRDLAITASSGRISKGPEGGPFTPESRAHTLTNYGPAPAQWSVAKTQPWLDLSRTGGTLALGASSVVTVSLNAQAALLVEGNYEDTITFTNLTTGRSVTRLFTLSVGKLDFLTEYFDLARPWPEISFPGSGSKGFDLSYTSLTFIPDDSVRGYQVLREPVTAFRTDPAGGTVVSNPSLERPYTYFPYGVPVALNAEAKVTLYGVSYSTFYIPDEGLIRFVSAVNANPNEFPFGKPYQHFDQPYISALFSDNRNHRFGNISWKQLPDRVAVTYNDVGGTVAANNSGVTYNVGETNNWQTEMFFDGRIRITYLSVAATFGTAGLSRGKGIPPEFVSSDFSTYPLYQELHLTLPGGATEGEGVLVGQGRVSIPTATGQNVVVKLKSSDASEATVPTTVTIPAGQLTATFAITILDDAEADGTQLATITTSTPLYTPSRATIAVHDNESGTFTITLPASAIEDVGTVQGSVQRSAASPSNLTISLTSNLPNAAQPSASVVIPAGQTSAPFLLTIPENNRLEGTRHVSITGTVMHWPTATAAIDIYDNEIPVLTLNIPSDAAEGVSPVNGSVSIGGALANDLTFALTSSDPTEVVVPSMITISAGQTSALFAIGIVDDTDTDGVQSAVITARTPSFPSASGTIRVADNDAHHFTFAPVSNSQVRNAPFSVSITARDMNDAVIANYSRAVGVTCADASQSDQPVAPVNLTGFVEGVWTGKLTVSGFGQGLILTVSDGAGHTGDSNPFSVGFGGLDHFAWSTIPSPQNLDTRFPVTVTAQDAANNTVTDFTGPVSLGAQNLTIGSEALPADVPLSPAYRASRTQMIYLASELKGARRITDLALYVATPSAQTLNRWTIRMKRTALASFASPNWEASGWTVVHQSNATIAAPGWVTFHLTTPFDYDGLNNLMVDFSFTNNSTGPAAFCRYSTQTVPSSRMLSGYSNASRELDPILWTGNSTGVPTLSARVLNVQFLVDEPVPIDPAQTGSFTSGVWSGNVSVPFVVTDTRLQANDGEARIGVSNRFDVISNIAAELPFNETFETGSFGPAWRISGTNFFRTQVTTVSGPHAGSYHAILDARNGGALSRNEATLTIDLADATGVTLSFWAKEFNDIPHGPPPTPFINGADFDGVAISADGVSWYEVQPLRTLTNSYARLTVDLDAAILARGLTYNPAFKIRFNQAGTTPFAINGIALDDISITGTLNKPLTISIPAQVSENVGSVTGAVSLPAVQSADVIVALQSNAPGRISVAPTITVPAGQLSASFAVMVANNATIDGTTSVTVRASATGFAPGRGVLAIQDDELNRIELVLPTVAGQTNRTVQGWLKLESQMSRPITVFLSSSAPAKAAVSAMVMIQPGQTVVPFNIAIGDEAAIDGVEAVTITASVPGWPVISGTFSVSDLPSPTLTLIGPSVVTEGDGTALARVSISAPISSPLTVALLSSDTYSITIPPSVTIPAGLTAATFAMTIVDDTSFDGVQNLTITATAPGLAGAATLAVSAGDNELFSFYFPELSDQIRGAPFEVTLFARDINGAPILNYAGPVTFSGSGSHGPIAITPTEIRDFVNGVWTGLVTVLEFEGEFVLTADDGHGHRLTTAEGEDGELIEVARGGTRGLALSTMPSPQTVGKPFDLTITALDNGGNIADFGPGFVSIRAGVPRQTVTTGSGTTEWDFPIGAAFKTARTQVIYPASELGGARRLTFLALKVRLAAMSSHAVQGWSIRMKHTPKESYANAAWETTGWTTLCQEYNHAVGDDWITFKLQNPFDYDGTSNLMVEFSYNNDRQLTSPAGTCQGSTGWTQRTLFAGSDDAAGDPLLWDGTNGPTPALSNRVPDIRLTSETPVAIYPQFADLDDRPQWMEQVTLAEAASGVRISVLDSLGHIAVTNSFDVTYGAPTLNAEPLFTRGGSNTVTWPGLAGADGYEVQSAIDPAFSAYESSGWITEADHTFGGLPDGVLQFYRARARFGAVETGWSAVVSSTQDATPPALTLALPPGQAFTTRPVITLEGTAADAAGLQSVSANGSLTNTSDAFAHWGKTVANLALGPNRLLVVAADQATPPNTATLLRSITREMDSDGDRLPDAWEIQHGFNPQDRDDGAASLLQYVLTADGVVSNGLVEATRQMNPADGQDYLVITYRRRVGLLDFRCVVETSEDLVTWNAADWEVRELVPAITNGDGVTEKVSVRIGPALDSIQRKVARVRVIAD